MAGRFSRVLNEQKLFVNAHALAYLNQLLLLLLILQLLEGARRVVVEHDQVPIAHVKTAQVITRVLRIVNVLILKLNSR